MIEQFFIAFVGVGIITAETILIYTMVKLNKNVLTLIEEFTKLSEQLFKFKLSPKEEPKTTKQQPKKKSFVERFRSLW